jgi:hypothetical protein
MQDLENKREPNWFLKLFRKRAKLTYWLDGNVFETEVCDFTEKSPECIVFSDYYTKKTTMVRYRNKITYVLEQVK